MKKLIILTVCLAMSMSCAFADNIPTAEEESAFLQNRQTIILKQEKIKTRIHGTKATTELQNNITQTDTKLNRGISQNTSGRNDILNINKYEEKQYLHRALDRETLRRLNSLQTAHNQVVTTILLDPYAINIDGQKYYLVRNRKNNDYILKDILGYDDTKSELFKDLKDLNSDKDTLKLTKDELKKADIRFVAVVDKKLALNDRSKDYDLNNISYIDLNTLRGTLNNGKIGSFGYFDVYILKNGKEQKVTGFVTFDSDEELWELIRK